MSDGFTDFSFGENDNNIGVKSKRFKGKEGETYRVSFVWFHENDDGTLDYNRPRFTGCERHYLNGVGYFLNKGPEYSKIAGGPPKQTVGTIICVWPTDNSGGLDKASFANGTGYAVFPWVFSAKKYKDLRSLAEDFPFHQHDVKIVCEDTQFQKMTFSPTKENLFTKLANSEKGAAIVEAIQGQVAKIAETLHSEMASDFTLDQIREKLGGGTSTPTAVGGAGESVDNLLDDMEL